MRLMNMPLQLFAIALAGLMNSPLAAEPARSVSFAHQDWELACDNTRTCKAAGYTAQAQEGRPVSMLLTRQAGPNSAVTARVKWGEDEGRSPQDPRAASLPLVLHIHGQPIGGALVWDEDAFTLTATQVQAVLASLTRSSRIELRRGDLVGTLSDQGAAAVLLKMDEFQGRLNTPGALMHREKGKGMGKGMREGTRKAARSESQALPPLPAPVVWAAPLAPPQPQDALFVAHHAPSLQRVLGGQAGQTLCPLWHEEGQARWAASRLSATKLLLSAPCWRAAYNEGTAYWVINERPPFQPVLVTESGTDGADGTLIASQKGRGLGDCTSTQVWTWDGQQFVTTAVETTGMCRGIAAGGAWRLPTFVTQVQAPKSGERGRALP